MMSTLSRSGFYGTVTVKKRKYSEGMLAQFKNVRAEGRGGFTLAEVIGSLAVLTLVIQGVILGFVMTSRRAEWSARSLAAQAVANQGAEQARAAGWNSQVFPPTYGLNGSDQLGLTNYDFSAV